MDDKGRVLANINDIYFPKHGGIHPVEAKEHHLAVMDNVLENALNQANIKISDVDIVSFSQGPGLPLSLKVGLILTKELARKTKKPVYGVNHCVAHIEIGLLETKLNDPVTLYVSGGNTQIIAFVERRYRCFGETLDIAIGNALDIFARSANLEHPGGPKIESLAMNGKYVELPYVVKGMDLSFAGIVTEAIRKLKQGIKLEDLCFSIQETCFAMLTEVTERALAHTGKSEVLLTGGVAANKRLQEMLRIMCRERGAKFEVVPREFAGDNGVMIAWTGILMHKSKAKALDVFDILPRWRTDEVEIGWK